MQKKKKKGTHNAIYLRSERLTEDVNMILMRCALRALVCSSLSRVSSSPQILHPHCTAAVLKPTWTMHAYWCSVLMNFVSANYLVLKDHVSLWRTGMTNGWVPTTLRWVAIQVISRLLSFWLSRPLGFDSVFAQKNVPKLCVKRLLRDTDSTRV